MLWLSGVAKTSSRQLLRSAVGEKPKSVHVTAKCPAVSYRIAAETLSAPSLLGLDCQRRACSTQSCSPALRSRWRAPGLSSQTCRRRASYSTSTLVSVCLRCVSLISQHAFIACTSPHLQLQSAKLAAWGALQLNACLSCQREVLFAADPA